MADCDAFTTREWKIINVTNYDETEGHVISIRQDGNKFAVRCKDHSRDYAKATCTGGVLIGDDGYRIVLKSGNPDSIEFRHEKRDGNQAGSWTANDNSGDDSGS
jgi:hypothetical protein